MSNGGKGQPKAPFLVIPYYTGDQGHRPLPSADPFWMCHSILIGGAPYGGQKLHASQNVELSLEAVNLGPDPTMAIAVFFWAIPTTNFSSSNTHLIGSTSLPLTADMLTPMVTPDAVQWTVLPGTPEHVCLIAMVTTTGDVAPTSYDAANNRHFGQQNVHLATASPGKIIRVGFVMANNRATIVRSRLEVTHILEKHRSLRHLITGDVLGKAEEVNLSGARSEAGRNGENLNVELAVAESLEIELTALVPRDARPGSTIVLQVAQYEERRDYPVGGLGIVIQVT